EVVRALLLPNANLVSAERALGEVASGMRDALVRHEERVREASRLIEHARDVVGARAFAEQTLEATEPLFARDACDRFSERLRSALASDASEGWPVHLSHRWLASLFERGELLRGVPLADEPLPSPLGAASFARALGMLGEMVAFADRPAGAPFSLLRSPSDDLGPRRGALFASLVLEPSFHQRKLGQSRGAAVEQTRRVGRASVTWLRTAALSVLARDLLLQPQGPREFEELSERALGRPLPASLLGVLPALSEDAGLALVAAADACLEREKLRQRFDEDWFDNPRCHEALRHEHHQLVSDRRAPPAEDDGGAARRAALAARLDEVLHE
ncbi:MAG: hypothetical protein JNK04_14100, partial [Myxococcales bacterium]|nr:hypothetical protein [Myxococcales bacterium]